MAWLNQERFPVIQVRRALMEASSASNSDIELKLQQWALPGNRQGFFVSNLHQITANWCKNVMPWCIF